MRRRLLALDGKSADAQVALGQVMLVSEWDWTAAERSFQRALAINPNHAEAYLHYGGLMEALGDLPRGLELKLQGLECDSTSALAHVIIGVSFWNQRRYDDVIVWSARRSTAILATCSLVNCSLVPTGRRVISNVKSRRISNEPKRVV